MSVSRPNKQDKQFKVSQAVLELVEKDGLNGLTYSKVARRSGVSRAWIYEYVGAAKPALTAFAAEVLAHHFSRADRALPKTRPELEKQLQDGVEFLFDSAAVSPVVVKLYFRYRGSENPIGNVIGKYEKKWLQTAQKTLVEVLHLPAGHAALLAELILTLRLAFAHRIATSGKSGGTEARERARQIFHSIHSLLAQSLS